MTENTESDVTVEPVAEEKVVVEEQIGIDPALVSDPFAEKAATEEKSASPAVKPAPKKAGRPPLANKPVEPTKALVQTPPEIGVNPIKIGEPTVVVTSNIYLRFSRMLVINVGKTKLSKAIWERAVSEMPRLKTLVETGAIKVVK